MSKKLTTFEREMKDEEFRKAFDKSYKEFLLSELLIAIMKEDEVSVRDLAKEIGLFQYGTQTYTKTILI